jgi:L-fucose isomerase-like protein
MLSLVTLCSELHGAAARERLGAAFAGHLDAAGVAHASAAAAGPAAGPIALALLTGGTEAAALAAVDATLAPGAPVLLLTHARANGFAAALEVCARLQQLGRRARVVAVDDPAARPALGRAVAGLVLWHRLRATRLALVGGPSDWLCASRPDDALVTERFGVTVTRVGLTAVTDAFAAVTDERAAPVGAELLAAAAGATVGADAVTRAARLALALDDVVAAAGADALALRCFELLGALGTSGCVALSRLLDRGVIAGCEGDVPTTLTMLVVHALTGAPPFMANPQAVTADGRVGFAHCTIGRRLARSYRLDTHFESGIGVGIAAELAPGPVTVVRLGGADLRGLFVADGAIVGAGADPDRCRTQVEVDLGPAARALLQQPLGNHHVLVPGHHAALVREAHALVVT